MKFNVLPILALVFTTNIFAETHRDWSYVGVSSPEKWDTINQNYKMCSGKNQSPINIDKTVKASLEPLKFDYQSNAKEIINNGHTIQVNFEQGSYLHLDGQKFELKQFHLHSPSENQIQGISYPMEMHLVHANEQGELAVVGIMYTKGKLNNALAPVWKQFPKEGETQQFTEKLTALSFLPKQRDYYRFNGSLTTPPCTEGVRWMVFKQVENASEAQLDRFRGTLEHPNNRPVQKNHARVVLE